MAERFGVVLSRPWPQRPAGAWHRRLRALIALLAGLALLGALAVQQWLAREALEQQLSRQNRDTAALLAQMLQPVLADAAARDGLLAAQLRSAHLQVLSLQQADGRMLWQRASAPRPTWAPPQYVDLMRLHPEPGRAALALPDAAAPLRLQLQSQTSDALDALWQGLLHSALALLALYLALLAAAAWALRSLRADLASAVTQAEAVQQGRFVAAAAPTWPELQPLAASMNQMAGHLRALFEAQAEQLEALRCQAHADALTGLPTRRHFHARLEQALCGEDGPEHLGLLLLRVRDLAGMNRRIGHLSTDHVLQAVAQTLGTYPQRVDGCFAGRLNGADFALLLPAGGVAQETARALVQALRLPLVAIDPAAGVVVGAVELRRPSTPQQALALADEALAHAETQIAFASVVLGEEAAAAAPAGEAVWQQRIGDALAEQRHQLAAFPVCTADGRLLHLDCPLRLQLEPDGAFEPAARWLPLAARSRLTAQVDERAVALALAEIERDGVARCVNISAQSLGVSDFMAAVSRRLEAAPQAATRLWIDLPEALALDRPALVQEAARRWRPLGVYLGLEHAGEGLMRIHRLVDLGLDCVRIDARFVQGLTEADGADARRYLQGLVRLVQSVGLSVTAEGVRSAVDLELLWGLGFDAATGPAVRLPAQD